MVSEETRKKIGDAHRGKIVPEDTRKKLSQANTGQKRSPETRRKMSEAKKGKPISEDTRRKMSEAWKGKSKPEEQRKNMSKAQKKRYGTDPNTTTEREITCEIIKNHHELLKEDPEHLPTDFIQKLIGINCDRTR